MSKSKSVPRQRGQGDRKSRTQVPGPVPPSPVQAGEGGGASAIPPSGRLDVEPATVRDAADALGALAPAMGGSLSDMDYEDQTSQEDAVLMLVDPLAGSTAVTVQEDLLRYGEVAAVSGVNPDDQAAREEQVSACTEAYQQGLQRQQDVDDGLAVVGERNRQLREVMIQGIPEILARRLLPEPLLIRLEAGWKRVQSEMDKQRQKAADQHKIAREENSRVAASLDQARKREDLLRTMLDLDRCVQVDPVRAARVIDTRDEVQKAEEDRGSGAKLH